MIKDAHELELMRVASQATLKCYEAVFKALKPGMTQNDGEQPVDAGYARLGFPGFASIQVGEYTALPHGSITPQTIREGTIIMLDDGCTVEGYQSDITRTFVLGKATDKMKKVFDIVHQAQSGGAEGGTARRAARGDRRRRAQGRSSTPATAPASSTSRTGRPRHGHGRPRVAVPGEEQHVRMGASALTLQPGMVFSDEPGIYIKGEFGVRLEDDMHITANGAELFTPQSPSIEDPFGAA